MSAASDCYAIGPQCRPEHANLGPNSITSPAFWAGSLIGSLGWDGSNVGGDSYRGSGSTMATLRSFSTEARPGAAISSRIRTGFSLTTAWS